MRKLTKEDFKRTENESPLNLYHQGIKAEETREKYTRTLRHVLCKIFEDIFEGGFEERVNEFVKLAREDPKWATDLLLNLSRILRDRTKLPTDHQDYLKPVSIDNYFKPFKKLLDMNEIPLSWERIYSTFPESDNNTEGRGWTRQEIQKMLKHVNGAMERSIILVAASSATRIGGFDYTWKDVVPIYKIDNELKIDITESEEKEAIVVCAMLSTYKGTNAEYPSFITSEAFSAIMDYKTEWVRDIGKDDKLFYKFKVLRNSRLRSSIIQNKIHNIGKIREMEREINLNADRKRFWLGQIQSINQKEINESFPISLNHFKKEEI